MSIQSEITLLQNTKKDLRNAILEKGVVVSPTDLFSTYPTRISQISMTPGDEDALFRSLIERTATSLTIPNGTEVLRYRAFYSYTTLTSVTIPNTVTHIGLSAFNGCTNLTSITCFSVIPPVIEGSVFPSNDCPIYVPYYSVQAYKTAWPQYASRIYAQASPYALFNSIVDGSITELEIPSGVLRLKNYALAYCPNLTSVTVPESVNWIDAYAFYNSPSLVSITFESTRPPFVVEGGGSTFPSNVQHLYVPADSVNAYKSANEWIPYASRIQAKS